MNIIANAIKPLQYHDLHLIAQLNSVKLRGWPFLLFVLFMRLFVLDLKFN